MAGVRKASQAAKTMLKKLDSLTTEGNSRKRLVEDLVEEEKKETVPETLEKSQLRQGED